MESSPYFSDIHPSFFSENISERDLNVYLPNKKHPIHYLLCPEEGRIEVQDYRGKKLHYKVLLDLGAYKETIHHLDVLRFCAKIHCLKHFLKETIDPSYPYIFQKI